MARSWTVRSAQDLGRAVADVRIERGMTQDDLAREAGIGRTYLAKLETASANLFLDRALRVLRRLGATVTVTKEERGDA